MVNNNLESLQHWAKIMSKNMILRVLLQEVMEKQLLKNGYIILPIQHLMYLDLQKVLILTWSSIISSNGSATSWMVLSN